MKTVTLKGQFCVNGVKIGKFAEIDFLYDGKNFHIPSLLDTDIPYTFIKDLDSEFGSDQWDCWEVTVIEDQQGDWHYCGDYGQSDYCAQYRREEW